MKGFDIDLVSPMVLPIMELLKASPKKSFYWIFLTESETHLISAELKKQYGFLFG